jgi:YcaO-like protein with predicted kinase domain
MSVRPLSRSLTVSQGKGTTHLLAKISAAMETIELSFAEHRVPRGIRYPLDEAVVDKSFLNPLLLSLRSDATFRLSQVVQWVEAERIGTGELCYVPRELIDRDSRRKLAKDLLFYSSSNGLSSGNSRDEALIHGLSEVIERDQQAFWLINKEYLRLGNGTRVSVDSINDDGCSSLLRSILNAGLGVAVWHATFNIPIPCFICSIWDDKSVTWYPQRAGGSGCHPYKRIALSRAITEAVQSRLTHIAGSRDDMYWSKYREVLPVASGGNPVHIAEIKSEREAVDYSSIPEAPTLRTMREILAWIIDRIAISTGGDGYQVQLSGAEDHFYVAHTVVPGLEMASKRDLYTPGVRMIEHLREHGRL